MLYYIDAEILATDVTQTVFLKYSLLKGMFIDSKSVLIVVFPWCALRLNKALPNFSFVLLKFASFVSCLEYCCNEYLFLKND